MLIVLVFVHYINSSGSITQNLAYSQFALQDMQKAIEKLDEAYKTPFMLHFKGFKYYEIAEILVNESAFYFELR